MTQDEIAAGLNLRDIVDIGDLTGKLHPILEAQGVLTSLATCSLGGSLGASFGWEVARGIQTGIKELTNVNLLKILVGAWNRTRVLADYRDHNRYPPDVTYLVQLSDHTVKSLHHPRLDILVDGQVSKTLDFDLNLELKVKGLILLIRGGKILGLSAGKARVKGILSLYGAMLWEDETEEMDLPGEIELSEGKNLPEAKELPGDTNPNQE